MANIKSTKISANAPESKSDNCCSPSCCEPATGNSRLDVETPGKEETIETDEVRRIVRDYYARRAVTGSSCCGGTSADLERFGMSIGYSTDELQAVPEGANLGLGCGNPTAIDTIPEGASVLDLGSGGGLDCFLAARKTGPAGRVIGVDMTPEMIDRARASARKAGVHNVEFRLGEIEALPVADATIDIVISNCVINLSPDKPRVFSEAFRVLKPGGRLMVSDIVLTRNLPDFVRTNPEAYAACLSGAELKDVYLDLIAAAGFTNIKFAGDTYPLSPPAGEDAPGCIPEALQEKTSEFPGTASPAVSLKVTATKPPL